MNRIRIFTALLLVVLLLPLNISFAQEADPITDDMLRYNEEATEDNDFTWSTYDEEIEFANELRDTIAINNPVTDGLSSILAGFLSIFTGLTLIILLFSGAASYIYSALALSKIGKDLKYKNTWFAWIPILNSIMILRLGDQNPWLLLLLLIPGIGAFIMAIISIVALANITEKRGYSKILILLLFIPFGAFIYLFLLAWRPKKVTT